MVRFAELGLSNPLCGSPSWLLTLDCRRPCPCPTMPSHPPSSAQVTQYLGYNSLKDFFPTMNIKPNPGCTNAMCRQRQAEWQVGAAGRAAAAALAAAEEAAAAGDQGPLHESNEWGIEVAPAEDEAVGAATAGAAAAPHAAQPQQAQQALPQGLQFSMPAGGGVGAEELRQEAVQETDAGLDDLMAQLELLSGTVK